ncbi:MAG: hypothetical protein O3A84_16840, partial [Proteobacteria bacterium]|nr:hypothetical protein [Pseudomonadota bacterium]
VDDMIRESELDDIKQQFQSIGNTNATDLIEKTVDPDGEIRNSMDFSGGELVLEAEKELDDEVEDALGEFDDIAEIEIQPDTEAKPDAVPGQTEPEPVKVEPPAEDRVEKVVK